MELLNMDNYEVCVAWIKENYQNNFSMFVILDIGMIRLSIQKKSYAA